MAIGAMSELDEQGPLQIGEIFNGYEIRSLLGRGGHAWVYHGHKAFMGRDVAIKMIHRPGHVSKEVIRRAKAEASLLNVLKHPNIVEVIDADVMPDGRVYIVMELLRGRTLRDVLRHAGRLSPEEALPVLAQVADAVEAAHQANAIHRDLKPENIFIGASNAPKVLDFGVAKVLDDAWTTQRNIVLGTMAYMSPEYIQGMRLTKQSDIYALGVVAYEALFGAHPCTLETEVFDMNVLAWFHVTRLARPLDEVVAGLPRFVARTVARAMAKNPQHRFATTAEFAAELRRCDQRLHDEAKAGGRSLVVRDLAMGADTSGVAAPPAELRSSDLTATAVRDTEPLAFAQMTRSTDRAAVLALAERQTHLESQAESAASQMRSSAADVSAPATAAAERAAQPAREERIAPESSVIVETISPKPESASPRPSRAPSELVSSRRAASRRAEVPVVVTPAPVASAVRRSERDPPARSRSSVQRVLLAGSLLGACLGIGFQLYMGKVDAHHDPVVSATVTAVPSIPAPPVTQAVADVTMANSTSTPPSAPSPDVMAARASEMETVDPVTSRHVSPQSSPRPAPAGPASHIPSARTAASARPAPAPSAQRLWAAGASASSASAPSKPQDNMDELFERLHEDLQRDRAKKHAAPLPASGIGEGL